MTMSDQTNEQQQSGECVFNSFINNSKINIMMFKRVPKQSKRSKRSKRIMNDCRQMIESEKCVLYISS